MRPVVVVRLLIAAATLVVLVGAGIVWAGGAHAAGRATPHQYRPVQVPVRHGVARSDRGSPRSIVCGFRLIEGGGRSQAPHSSLSPPISRASSLSGWVAR